MRLAICLLLPGLLPIVAPYPPFQDWPGHVGIAGALIHFDEPQARLASFYELRTWARPNILFYFFSVLLAEILPPLWAVNICMGVSLAALGPATAALCRRLGADERLAVLSLPLALGRHLYCGFVPYAAALPLAIWCFAAFFALIERPSLRRVFALFAFSAATLMMHLFAFLATAGLLLLMSVLGLRRTKTRTGSLGALAAVGLALLGLGVVTSGLAERAGSQGNLLGVVARATIDADRAHLFSEGWTWLFASYKHAKVDDYLQGMWLLSLVALCTSGLARDGRRVWMRAVAVAATIAAWMILPMYIPHPVGWWAANVRLLVLAALLAIPLGGARAPEWLLRTAAAVSLVAVIGALAELRNFDDEEMNGFAEVIAAIPPGKKISCMHYSTPRMGEYPGAPFGYVCNYYILMKGGYVPLTLFGNPDTLVAKKFEQAAPGGFADAGQFSWQKHGADFDGFVVHISPENPAAPFNNSNKVRLVEAAGKWRYYENRGGRPRDRVLVSPRGRGLGYSR